MKLYFGCAVDDESEDGDVLVCGNCGNKVLDRLGIDAITGCSTGWGRVARHDHVAKTTQKNGIEHAGLACESKYFKR